MLLNSLPPIADVDQTNSAPVRLPLRTMVEQLHPPPLLEWDDVLHLLGAAQRSRVVSSGLILGT